NRSRSESFRFVRECCRLASAWRQIHPAPVRTKESSRQALRALRGAPLFREIRAIPTRPAFAPLESKSDLLARAQRAPLRTSAETQRRLRQLPSPARKTRWSRLIRETIFGADRF